MSSQGSTAGLLDRYFHISERGSTVPTELRGGVVTFFAMAYIIILNPLILGTGADSSGTTLGTSKVAAVTAFAAGVMTIAFGLIAKYPFGFAAGLGINNLVAVTFVAAEGLTWSEAMGLVVINGIIIMILAVTGFREAVFNSIPDSLKAAIGVGIGLFIAMIGLVDSGFVRRIPDSAHTTVPVGLGINGSIASWPTLVFVVGLLICGALVVRQVRGGLFIGIVATTVLALIVEALTHSGPSMVDGKPHPSGWSLAVPRLPESFGGLPDLSLLGAFDLLGAFSRVGVLAASLLVFTLVLANFFDAMGTMTALGKQAKLTDEKGRIPGLRTALIVEGCGAVVGGAASASSNTVYVDSASGIGDGARTGLANVVTGGLFLVAMFLTPLYEIVPIEAAAPVLVVVGAMMIAQVTEIDFRRFEVALPAFLTIVVMPFTYSIANGIGVGFVAYVVMAVIGGRGKQVHPLLYIVATLFVVYFAVDPVLNAVT
ncbi:NCS2 family permease [Corynebacterium heidelbergense]|uniref:MFS transporter n=1 Tax=Corynebacterium heidelbergense TaxID=2055947 RepID=A0A364VCC4_9CORY|nr:NCS2 family permease [Corynebacterium heidelbergense]RAV34281.1 MFS transporter [Corynebacterium heidelbergense]WCZ35995.1 Guanine/hypoxanthine permease PbuG [Corynebacterium heidelbergense]